VSSFSATDAQQPVISYPLDAGGVLTRVLECGNGDDVVLFLHGSGARADRWRANLSGMAARGYRALAVDFPGHGFAAKMGHLRYDTPAFVAMVADFVSGLDISSITIVGTSLGAHVAASYACTSPSRVRASVLVGALGIVPVHRDPQQTTARVADTSAEGVESKLRMLLHDKSLISPAWIEEERRMNTSPGATRALADLRTYLDSRVNDELVGEQYASLGLPTLLIWGEDDKWVLPRYGLEAAKLLKGTPLVFLKEAGHAPYLERSDTFNAVVDEFLRDPAGFGSGIRHL